MLISVVVLKKLPGQKRCDEEEEQEKEQEQEEPEEQEELVEQEHDFFAFLTYY